VHSEITNTQMESEVSALNVLGQQYGIIRKRKGCMVDTVVLSVQNVVPHFILSCYLQAENYILQNITTNK